ncbi:MAG: adenosine kinase [Spirochaetota bacterium]
MENKNIDIVNIGNVIMDIIIRITDKDLEHLGLDKGIMHLVEEERQVEIVKYLQDHKKELEMGGAGPNVLRTVATLGGKGCIAGVVAGDEFGDIYTGIVDKLGITNRIRKAKEGITGTSIILVTEDGQRTMNTCLGNSRYYNYKDVPVDVIKTARYLFITGYQWDTEKQIEAMNYALETAKNSNTKIAFDLADPFAVNRSKESFKKVIENYADIVFANEEEAKMMYGEHSPEKCLEILSDKCEIAIVKIGKKGSLVRTNNNTQYVKASDIKVLDTTAAGDMYAGGFMYGLINNYNVKDCARIANLCAEEVIQNIGAKLPSNIKEQVESLFHSS